MTTTDLLVHGPLTALMLVEALLAPSSIGGGSSLVASKKLASFTYRAVNPVIVNRQQHLCGALISSEDPILTSIKEEKMEGLVDAEKVLVWAEDDEGVVGMTGVANLVPSN